MNIARMFCDGVNDDMTSIVDYHRSDPIQGFFQMSPLDNDDPYPTILDMDTTENKEFPYNKRGCETAKKKFFLGEEFDEADGNAWSTKPIKEWSQGDTINWLMSAASHMGQAYCSIQHTLAIPGRDLITLTKQDFIFHDRAYGDKLYELLHSQRVSNFSPHFPSIHQTSEDERTHTGSSTVSDAESEDSVEVSPKRPGPGRPKGFKQKKNSTSQGKLWEYIRDLLRNPETCPSLICWEDYSQAKFRFVRSDEVAKRWGARKGNTKMTYEKLSRAMRYYYKSKIFLPVLGRRLVYQFGPNAKGWETDNPNFRR
ncbi:ETS-related transcription factor Elf-5 [Fopius arisanus]|uniref:EHF_1 protein n=2 Tax=Braconidae TaxID=7402 RepID=A0A0C9RDV7_9HYME|nr:PREDICTED: ETS-related transcription factor Elf-5-like [Fopius arisanus]